MSFDGVKIARELSKWKRAWLDGDNTATHFGGAWVNRFTEAARASPYGSGHVDAVLYPLFVLLALSGWVALAIYYVRTQT